MSLLWATGRGVRVGSSHRPLRACRAERDRATQSARTRCGILRAIIDRSDCFQQKDEDEERDIVLDFRRLLGLEIVRTWLSAPPSRPVTSPPRVYPVRGCGDQGHLRRRDRVVVNEGTPAPLLRAPPLRRAGVRLRIHWVDCTLLRLETRRNRLINGSTTT